MPAQKSSDPQPNIDIGTPYTPRRPAPVVSISINHPIGTAFRKIKNFLTHKQTLFSTSFTIKITPIVAIVSLFGVAALFGGGITTAFTLGKTMEQKFLQTAPTPTPVVVVKTPAIVTVSRAGIVKATYAQNNSDLPAGKAGGTQVKLSPSESQKASDASALTPTVIPTPTPTVLHYILVLKSGSINYLAGGTIHFQNYLNLRVLINGSYDSSKNTLTVNNTSDIEILP